MPPKAIAYRANSIIYFKGDLSDRVFILNAGKVALKYIDVETGQDIHEYIKTGEFFGVKSALGRYPREETAISLTDAKVIAFSVPDFEQLAAKNSRVILKMLKVFSNQLRRIHKRVQNLLAMEDQTSPEVGLYRIGEYYLNTRQYSQAIYAFGRYLVYYPSGQFADAANRNLEAAERGVTEYGQGPGPGRDQVSRPDSTRQLSNTAERFYEAVSMVTNERYQEALKEFLQIIESGGEQEYISKAQFEVGRCLYYLGKYPETIRSFTSLIQNFPKHPDLGEAIFYVAQAQAQLGQTAKAEGLYRKLLSMTRESEALYKKVRKAMRDLEAAT